MRQQHRTPARALDAAVAGSHRKRGRAHSQAADAAALPHVHRRPNGRWEVRLGFPHEAGGPGNPNVGTFNSQDEGAVARSLALAFHQHSQGAPLSAVEFRLLHTLASLQSQKAMLRDVRACANWQSLRDLLQQWQVSGKLRRLATSLTLATAAVAPPTAATARPDRQAQQRGGNKRRRTTGRQAQQELGAAATGASALRAAAVPTPHWAPRRRGEDAVGRRVRIWLRLDDEVEQQHDGRIVEVTPTGRHHVVYDDGEEGLVDLAAAQFRFLPPAVSRTEAAKPHAPKSAAAAGEAPGPASFAGVTAAIAPALEFTSAADVGKELHVWWPKDRVWYLGEVTYVLRNGLLCVRYQVDDMELLVDAAESKVHWVSAPRQQRHKHLLRQQERRRKAAKEAERAARLAQRRQRQQQQEQRQGDAGSQNLEDDGAVKVEPDVEEPPPPPPLPPAAAGMAAAGAAGSAAAAAGTSASAGPAATGAVVDMFDFMMDCAELPEAAAAGFTQELACSFSSLLDMLPPAQQAAKEARLRGQLEQRKFNNAAALARTELNLALTRARQA